MSPTFYFHHWYSIHKSEPLLCDIRNIWQSHFDEINTSEIIAWLAADVKQACDLEKYSTKDLVKFVKSQRVAPCCVSGWKTMETNNLISARLSCYNMKVIILFIAINN